MSASLRVLDLSDPPERWAQLGFELDGDSVWLGGIELRLGRPGRGIVGWGLSDLDASRELGLRTEVASRELAGLPTEVASPEQAPVREHPNGAIAVDHVVVLTGDFDRTAAELSEAGLPLRRIRDVPNSGTRPPTRPTFRQGFRRLGPAILELVEAPEAGGPRFWGLVVVVRDLHALAATLGEHLGQIKPAVQPGRRIATLRASAGLSEAVAFMDSAM